MSNDIHHVRTVMNLLEEQGVTTWLFGGWAEELLGMAEPRDHHDVDLLYLAINFDPVDRFLRTGAVQEIVPKRLPHKRAFMFDGVMTEIIIVQPNLTTTFWDQTCYAWPSDVFNHRHDRIRLASPASLSRYRSVHNILHKSDS